jgi:hypothetical protein
MPLFSISGYQPENNIIDVFFLEYGLKNSIAGSISKTVDPI